MSRTKKIILSSLLVVGLAVGYGVYWWYWSEDPTPAWLQSIGPSDMAAHDIRVVLSAPGGTPEKALQRLEKMSYYRQKEVFLQLTDAPEEAVRLFAVTNLTSHRFEPEVKDVLQRLSTDDPSEIIRGTALRLLKPVDKKKLDGHDHNHH